MRISRSSLRFPLALLAGMALLIGCQIGSDTEPETSTAMTARGTVDHTDTLRVPDWGVWRTNNTSRKADTGRGAVTCTPKAGGKGYECSQSFALTNVLGGDRLVQDWYALGVHFATSSYSQTGNQTQLTHVITDFKLNNFESKLIRQFNTDFKAKNPGKKPGSMDLTAYYAELVLKDNPLVKDSALPKGLVLDTVQKVLVRVAVELEIPAKALVAKGVLNIKDEATVRSIVGVLIKAGIKIDTTKLYPAPLVRVVDSLKVARDVVEGEDPVPVSGAFAWEPKGIAWKTETKVVTSTGAIDTNIRLIKEKDFDPTSGSYSLTNNLSIVAKKGAIIGVDTLIMTVRSESGVATSKTTFKVVRGDVTPPTVSIVEPAPGTEVPNTTEKIKVRVEASDAKGIAEVKIRKVVLTAAPYTADIDLEVGFTIISVEAKDLAGNVSYDTVVVSRKKSTTSADSVPPVLTLKSPSTDTLTVAQGLPSLELSWTATDNTALKKVTLNDAEVTGTAGAYSKSVPLHDGENVFEIKAFDDVGNVSTKKVTITRPADLSKAGITPPSDKTVEASDTSATLVWKITNLHKVKKITLNGTELPLSAEIVREVSLKPGANPFVIVVTDLSDATVSETTVITRKTEVVLPSIAPLADRNVPADNDTALLTWTITNSDKAKSATLNGEEVAVAATITKSVKLDPGANLFKLVLKDAAGTEVSSSVKITRAIDTALLALSRPADRTVPPETESDSLTWTVYNSSKAVSAALNGKPVAVGATIGARVDLAVGNNLFRLVLKTAKGDSVADTVIVARTADVTGPTLVWVAPTTKTHAVEASVTSYLVQVKVTDPSGVDSVYLNGVPAKKETGDLYSLSLALPKPDGNPMAVTVVAKDARGNATKDSVTVSRKVPDGTNKPVIKLVKPLVATGNTLKYEEASLHVEADITDALLAIDAKSVTIGGVAATATGSVYAADVPVPATGAPTTITIKAANANGIASTLDVVVTRAKDTLKPVITPDAATKTQSVEYGTKSVDLSWTVTDNHKVVTILYNGLSIPVTGTVKQTFELKVGENPVTLVAIDSMGNKDSLGISITRKGDVTPPVVTITKPAAATTVAYGTKTLDVTASATDAGSGLKSLTIDGTATTLAAGGTVTVDLVAGKNEIKAIATDNAGNSDTATVVVTVQDIVATPVFTPKAGTYTSMQSVSIACATAGAKISYSIDGGTPVVYSAPFNVGASHTITATATLAGWADSKVATAEYVIDYPGAAAPTFSVLAGTYGSAQSVTITSATTGAAIYYTMDGTDPTTASTKYATPVSITKNTTLKAIATASGFDNSTITSADYKIRTAAPTFLPAAGTNFTADLNVTLSSTTSGATIHYTTDGTTTPTTLSAKYTAAIPLSQGTKTIKAIAVAANMEPSTVSSALYTIKYPTLTAPKIESPNVTGTRTVTISTAEAGTTIHYSTTGTATAASPEYKGPFTVNSTTTVSAISVKAGYNNSPVTAVQIDYTAPSVDLESITVGGTPRSLNSSSSTIINWELPAASKTVLVTAKAVDPKATVLVGNSAGSKSYIFNENTTSVTVTIKVTNNGISKSYTLNLSVPTAGTFNDSRDGKTYSAILTHGLWFMTSDLEYDGGPLYTWSKAMDGQMSSAPRGLCPEGWEIVTQDVWYTVVDGGSADLNVPGLIDNGSSSYWLPYDPAYEGYSQHMMFGRQQYRPQVYGEITSDGKTSVRCYTYW